MKNNKNGFTLIELLAVIVVLAIIALITILTVSNTIENAKKGAAEDSAYAIEKSAEYHHIINSENFLRTEFDCTIEGCLLSTDNNVKLDIKGTVPSSGTVVIESNGEVTVSDLVINGYNCIKINEKYSCGSDEETTEEPEPTFAEYEIGATINFNPETNTSCTSPISETGTKTGCMRWYVIESSPINSSTVKVILDHNTTSNVVWNSTGDNTDGMIELANKLTTDTATWEVSLDAHVPSAQEIATAIGYSSWNGQNFNFETKTTRSPNPYTGEYGWLYDRTYNCEMYGCATSDNSTYGYWTSIGASNFNSYAFGVVYSGYLCFSDIGSETGLRPVITIKKSQL